jgi:predicted O-methyltransferase YrrM
LSYILQPKNVLGIGIFTGNPLVWSLGPAIDHVYEGTKLVGVEIDQNSARLCQDNMDQVRGDVPVVIFPEDGFEVINRYEDGEVDLLYLDANGYDPTDAVSQGERTNSKNINYGLLKKAYDKICPGGVVLCHNAYQPSFLREAGDYLDLTSDENLFDKTATIGIDEMGLEFTIKW